MNADPVVQEMRDHGARIAEECDGDIHRMAERFRREQAEHPTRVVRRKSRPNRPPRSDPKPKP